MLHNIDPLGPRPLISTKKWFWNDVQDAIEQRRPKYMATHLEEAAKTCAEWINKSERIAVLSGAGMSTSAGIPDFRGPTGLYKTLDIPDPHLVFEIETFRKDPSIFYRFGKEFLTNISKVEPTFSHHFLAALEKAGKMAGIITQNIDALHQRAGSEKVLEIHGGVWHTHCTKCQKHYDYEAASEKILTEDVPLCADCNGVLKPDVVFFGEPVKGLYECQALAQTSDLFFVLGTSLTVSPAAMMPGLSSGSIVVVHKGEISHMYLPRNRISLFADEYLDGFFKRVNSHLGLL